MPIRDDVSAWLMQKSAPLTVHYGRSLGFEGQDLRRTRMRVPTRRGVVRCEVYEPADPVGSYVHLHGGAFVMRYPRMDDFFCRHVAAEVGVRVVNVDYDVAPQARYPVAQEQAHDVMAFLAQDGPVMVGGFGAGGNLAASAALQARDLGSCAPRLQLLGVASLDVAEEADAKRPVVGTSPMITPGLVSLVRRTYFADADRRAEPYASPLRAPSLEGVAAALVITGERDLLRAEGDAYAGRLRDAGVRVEHVVVPGADHYFLTSRKQARPLLDRVVDAMKRAMNTAPPSD